MKPPPHRASDPGLRRQQFGHVVWVHCPQCDGPAKHNALGVKCIRCGYMTIPVIKPAAVQWARITISDPRCSHCRNPLPDTSRPLARGGDENRPVVRVRCPHCAKTMAYPARAWSAPSRASQQPPRHLKPYLTAQVAGNVLMVDNLAHLSALETYLGAALRERGPVRGLTMMARLPAWMKSSTNRAKILRSLRQLADRASKDGIDE